MKKKLTLNQTWKYCLEMWKWIVEQTKQGSDKDSHYLKGEWLKKHPDLDYVVNDCFFCDYNMKHEKNDEDECSCCPGRLVNKRLRKFWCERDPYDWLIKPIKFYQKLVALDKKRKQ